MSKKHSLELNKIAGGFLLAGVIGMFTGFLSDGLYSPKEVAKRGFSIEVAEAQAGETATVAEVDIGTLLAAADAKKGEGIAQKKCTSCHSFEKGGANKVGPNLNGIVGNKVAHSDSFSYSDGVKNHGGKWGYDELNQWLKGPAAYIKGTRMAFAGIKNDAERADVIAYLKSISDGAPAFPAAKAVAPAAKK